MPTFKITGPDGKSYRVTGENAEGALQALQQHLGSAQMSAQPNGQTATDAMSEMSAMTKRMDGELPGGNLAAARYEAMPEWKKPLMAAADTVDLLANGVSLGHGNKMAAAIRAPFTDKTYDEELEGMRAQTERARDRAGWAGTAAEVAGALATMRGVGRLGGTLMGRFGTSGMTGARGLAARSGLAGVEGAGYGALTAEGNDQDVAEGAVLGLVGGALGNAAGEGISAGVSKVAGLFNKKPAIPTAAELTTLKDAAYKAADNAGVAYTPQAVAKVNNSVTQGLTDLGYDPALMPGAAVAVKRLQDLQGQNVTLTGLDTIRKIASNGYIPGNKANNAAVRQIIQSIDDLIDNAGTGDVLMGNGAAAAGALKEARSLASRVAKNSRVEEAVSKAELRAASTGSGGNADNATRQNLRRLLETPRGFTADERAALETAVRGNAGQNALRLAGKLAPTGVVSGVLSGGAGLGMLGPAGLALPLAGAGAKAVADRMTKKNVEELAKIILAGGNASATKAAPNAVQRLAQSKRDALARLLMGIGANEAGTPAR